MIEKLKNQIANHLSSALEDKRAQLVQASSNHIAINPYKLFFYRHNAKLTQKDVAIQCGVSTATIQRLEKPKKKDFDFNTSSFNKCHPNTIACLEKALGCEGRLTAGQDDDFLNVYIQYHQTYKKLHGRIKRNKPIQHDLFPTKAVVFDFDGTLTHREDNKTSWERIWLDLGYDINECAKYHAQYSNGKITHQEWCDITCSKFQVKGISEETLTAIAKEISLVPGTKRALEKMASAGIKLFLVSGSITHIIDEVLGETAEYFDDIRANEFKFTPKGILRRIRGTRYDFQGKADFLKKVMEKHSLQPLEVLFVGNSCNDIFASQSGAKTLCINPRYTDPTVAKHWTYFMREVSDLNDIMTYVGSMKNQSD